MSQKRGGATVLEAPDVPVFGRGHCGSERRDVIGCRDGCPDLRWIDSRIIADRQYGIWQRPRSPSRP